MSFLIPFDFHEGDRLDGMTVVKPIGRGGSGDLYLVRRDDGMHLVLKVIRKMENEGELNGIEQCRAVASRIPGLVPVLKAGKLPDGRLCYAMAPADNLADWPDYEPDSLTNRIRRDGKIPPDEVLDIAEAVLGTIRSLHAVGLAHCDIKPENILFLEGRPMLADFGLISETGDRPSGGLAGTIGFIPPEMVENPCYYKPQACDLYALGKVVYCAWSGADVKDYPSVPGNVTLPEIGAMRPLYMAACSSSPHKRFHNADEFLAAVSSARVRLNRRFAAGRTKNDHRFMMLLMILLVLFGIALIVANVLLFHAWKTKDRLPDNGVYFREIIEVPDEDEPDGKGVPPPLSYTIDPSGISGGGASDRR